MQKLAILGGEPIRTKPFPLWPQATEIERTNLKDVIDSNGYGIFRGTRTFTLEEKFANYHGANFGVACSNATVALQVQLQCLSIGRGDEVITTVFTCVSTITAIVNVGAIPIFVDIDEKNYCINTALIESKITSRTRAIVAVHLYNSLCDLDELVRIAQTHNLSLIEDAAQVPGSFYKQQGVGTYGVSGSFSFQEAKIMTCGEGGIIISNDRQLADLARSYVNCGRVPSSYKISRRVMGGNYRMTDFQAAILLGQLEFLRSRTDKREKSVFYLNSKLKELPGIDVIAPTPGVTKQACYYYIFKIMPEVLGFGRDIFTRALEAEGVPTRNLFLPLYKDPLFNLNRYDTPEAWQYYVENPIGERDYPVAERAAFTEGIAIWHPFLLQGEEDLEDLVNAVKKLVYYASTLRSETMSQVR